MLTDFNDFWLTASWRNLTLVDSPAKVVHKFESTLFSSKWVALKKKLVVLCGKINGSNATESVQSDHPVHGHMLPVANGLNHNPLL